MKISALLTKHLYISRCKRALVRDAGYTLAAVGGDVAAVRKQNTSHLSRPTSRSSSFAAVLLAREPLYRGRSIALALFSHLTDSEQSSGRDCPSSRCATDIIASRALRELDNCHTLTCRRRARRSTRDVSYHPPVVTRVDVLHRGD